MSVTRFVNLEETNSNKSFGFSNNEKKIDDKIAGVISKRYILKTLRIWNIFVELSTVLLLF